MADLVIKNALVDGAVTDLTITNGKISKIGVTKQDGIDAACNKVFAGLIDLHAHGCMNIEVNSGRIEELSDYEAKHGTTAWLPTTSTVAIETIYNAVNRDITKIRGAHVLGFHAEGPYINKEFKGAQDPKFIHLPDIDEFNKLPNIKMVTVAPEVEGALDFIKACDAIVALGHTSADYDTTIKAIECGANCLTHTFNAMPPMLHRDPGVIGAAVEKRIYAQLICDGFHVMRGAMWLIYRAFGPERMVMISDSISAAGLPAGKYTSGGLAIVVNDGDVVARLEDGTIAGSKCFLLDGVKTAIQYGIPEADAFRMASQTPAELLGINKGKVEVGYDADLIILDNDYNLLTTIIDGEIYYQR